MVQDKHLITIMCLYIMYALSYIKACKNANISETGLDTHIVTIIHRQEFEYALSLGISTSDLG